MFRVLRRRVSSVVTLLSTFILAVISVDARSASVGFEGQVAAPLPSEASFVCSVTEGLVPLTVSFTDESTGTPDSWQWDLGDGTVSTASDPVHTYSTPGWYTVTLTVESQGVTSTLVQHQLVLAANEILTVHQGGSIQAALTAADDYDLVIVDSGTYTGSGNRDLDFGGKNIYLKSDAGALGCTIDAEDAGRAFLFDSGESADAVVDGFSLVNGSAVDGGAVSILSTDPTLKNCILDGNHASDTGGAIYAEYSEVAIRGCLFQNNTSIRDGGAIGFVDSADPVVFDSTFLNNGSNRNGGAILCDTTDAQITDCVFSDNGASSKGGAVYTKAEARPLLRNCLLDRNTAASGGAVYATQGGPRMEWCSMVDNTANKGGALWAYRARTTRLIRCRVEGNTATAGDAGGLGYFFSEGGEITSCLVTNNQAAGNGGGIVLDDQSRPEISGSLIAGNTAAGDGGGLWGQFQVFTSLINCVVADNSAAEGGALYLKLSSELDLKNTIVWGNVATSTMDGIYLADSSTAALDHCAYEDGVNSPAATATASLTSDPMFQAAILGDYHLLEGSPCLDAGSDPLVPAFLLEDLDGEARIAGAAVDMGVFEGSTAPPTATRAVGPRVALFPNYPNPFNPTTVIAFQLPRATHVDLRVYDVAGRQVRVLVDETFSQGRHQVRWNGEDRHGKPVATGVYYSVLRSDGDVAKQRMVLLK